MTDLQRLTLRGSEIRARLAELGGVDEFSDEQRSELERLRKEYADTERRCQALTIAGDAPKATEGTPEGRELAALEKRANVGELFDHVLEHRAADGAMREVQEHYGLSGNQVPLSLLEHRAVTMAPSDVGQNQAEIIPYVFPQSAAAFIGADMPTIGVGEAVYPVLSSTLSVEALAENAAGTETTGAFTADVLSPSRLQSSFFWSREDRARFAGMDSALRMNLSDGLADGLDRQIIQGVNGLLGTSGLTARTGDAAAEATFTTYRGLIYDSETIDGRYSSMASDIRVLMGTAGYNHSASTYRANNADDSGLDAMMRVSGGVRVSAHVPAPSSNDQAVIVRKGMNRDFVVPVWEGVSLIADEITKAANGQIVVTAVMLYSMKILRAEGFQRRTVKVA